MQPGVSGVFTLVMNMMGVAGILKCVRVLLGTRFYIHQPYKIIFSYSDSYPIISSTY